MSKEQEKRQQKILLKDRQGLMINKRPKIVES